ncbi:MAG: hypothetical protein V3R94_01530 [Acidobacteriota bacterium]
MSPESENRRGYELPSTYQNLQELWRGHYDHFNEVLKEFLVKSYQGTDGGLEFLEVGVGARSVLMRGLQETQDEQSCPDSLRVHFVDSEPLDHIEPACVENSALVADCQTSSDGVFEPLNNGQEISWTFTQQDFMEFLAGPARFDFILLHGVLHEIYKYAGVEAKDFFPDFFIRLAGLLHPQGKILIADTYYPLYLSEEQIEEMIRWQREVIHHADPPEAFVHPEQILKLMLTDGEVESRLEILFEEERRYRACLPDSSVARKFYTLGLGLKT